MANLNAPFGLTPVRLLSGSPYNGTGNTYFVPSTDATAIGIGDPVNRVEGTNSTQILQFPPNTLATVTRATAGANPVSGVMVGRVPATQDSSPIRTANAAGAIIVCDNPGMVYEVMCNNTISPFVDTWIGQNANLAAGTASAANGGASGFTLDTNTVATTSSLQVKILGLARTVNNAEGDFAVLEVILNTNNLVTGTAGV